jgi:hypothetical protein
MKSISEKLTELIENESRESLEMKNLLQLGKTISKLKKTGIIKQSTYDFPMVDTIGKTLFSSLNKK